MKPDKFLKHAAAVLAAALAGYAGLFWLIEHWRTRTGPWEITFNGSATEAPALIINQPRLGITNVQIVFAETNSPREIHVRCRFDQARPVPFDLPFGRCVFLDTTTLPGTVALEIGGHQIQLLPRTLTIDHHEQPWRPAAVIHLEPPAPPPPGNR